MPQYIPGVHLSLVSNSTFPSMLNYIKVNLSVNMWNYNLSYLNQSVIIKYHILSNINRRKIFLTIQEVVNFEVKIPIDLVSCKNLFPGSLMAMFSVSSHMEEGSRELSGVCFIRILISFMKTYDLITYQEHYIQYHNLQDEDSSRELWGDINLQSIASFHIFLLSLIILAHTIH